MRTYVRSATDEPGKLDPLAIGREIHAGHAMMTTGPFLEATVTTAEGVQGIPGDVLTTKAATASLHVRVQCPNWIALDRIECRVNGQVDRALSFDRAQSPDRFKTGQFDQTVELTLRSLQSSEDALLGGKAFKGNTTTLYIPRLASPPGIAPAKLPIIVEAVVPTLDKAAPDLSVPDL